MLRIAVASGKGGTGKTLVALMLSVYLSRTGKRVIYVDADVEEPNGHLFLRPEIKELEQTLIMRPCIDEEACDKCKKCAYFCKYGALVITDNKNLLIDELCGGCGGCEIICPKNAISKEYGVLGSIEGGFASDDVFNESKGYHRIKYYRGVLKAGEARATPIVKSLFRVANDLESDFDNSKIMIIDSAPGTGCSVIETMRNSDAVLLVAEPTPFGAHDLRLSIEIAKKNLVRCYVIINKSVKEWDGTIETVCRELDVRIIARVPYSMDIARKYSSGSLPDEKAFDSIKHIDTYIEV